MAEKLLKLEWSRERRADETLEFDGICFIFFLSRIMARFQGCLTGIGL
jgi:hypothetical protein